MYQRKIKQHNALILLWHKSLNKVTVPSGKQHLKFTASLLRPAHSR